MKREPPVFRNKATISPENDQSELPIKMNVGPQDEDIRFESKSPEIAGKFKYILVWCLAAFVAFGARKFTALLVEPITSQVTLENLFLLYSIEKGALYFATVLSVVLVYLCFKNLVISRVMPYFWGLGLLGFLLTAGGSASALGTLYTSNGLIWVDLGLSVFSILLINITFAGLFPDRYNGFDRRKKW